MADTLKAELASDAFREGNLIAVGQIPIDAELDESQKLLNRLIISLLGTEIGEHFQTLHLPRLTQNCEVRHIEDPNKPKANRRVLLSNSTNETIELPRNPMDGARFAISNVNATGLVILDGMGAFIDNGVRDPLTSLSLSTSPGDQYDWFYRADLSMWVLTQASQAFDSLTFSPFPPEIDGLLVAGTSLRLQAYYGNEPVGGTVSEYQRMIKVVRARYRQSEAVRTTNDQRITPDVVGYNGVWW